MKFNINKLIWGGIILLISFSACSKDGDYSKYLKDAEKAYPGRPDSVVVRSGNNRAQIVSLLSSDPRIVNLRIYWNSRRDSVDAKISAADLSKRKAVDIPTIPEGIYTFELATFDALGNRSVFTEKTGQIYGAAYLSGLVNRVIKSKSIVDDALILNWFPETDKESTIVGVEVTYPKLDGGTHTVFTPREVDVTKLDSAAPTGEITIRTSYKPENAIETFYSQTITVAY